MTAFASPINLLPHRQVLLPNKVATLCKSKWASSIATDGTNESSSKVDINIINNVTSRRASASARHVLPLRKKNSGRVVTRKLFVQRMATIQDKKWTHKLSGFSCVMSSAAILACAPIMSLVTGDFVHLHIPPLFIARPLLYVWASSISMLSISGTVLAIRHRPNQIFERNIFVSSSLSNIFSALIAIRCTTTGGFFSTVISALIITGATSSSMLILDPNVVKRSRRRSSSSTSASTKKQVTITTTTPRLKKRNTPQLYLRDRSLVYCVPLLCGLPFLTFVGIDLNALVNQTTFFNLLSANPALHSVVIYGDVLNGLCAGIGAFILTMKDRKVISKSREHSLVAFSSLISVALSAIVVVCSTSVNVGSIIL